MSSPQTEGTSSLFVFITTSSLVVLSWFFMPSIIPNVPFIGHKFHQQTTQRRILNYLLLIHTLFILHRLILLSPPNVFTMLGLSLGTPTDSIRSLLLAASTDGVLPNKIEFLLGRLGSAEMRAMYVRFGHEAVSTCEWCSNFYDFALYTGTRVVLEYLREAAVIGLVTIRSTNLERFRSYAIGALLTAAAGETYAIATAEISIPRGGRKDETIMWYDTLTPARNVFFLVVPLIIHFILPPSPPKITQEMLNHINPNTPFPVGAPLPQAFGLIHSTINRLRLIRFSRGAFSRLDDNDNSFWSKEKEEGTWVREDEEVRTVARGLGIGYDTAEQSRREGVNRQPEVGDLRKRASQMVALAFQGFLPNAVWANSSR